MRGEDIARLPNKLYYFGSPPHAWGRHTPQQHNLALMRFTPTCVGKTRVAARCWRWPAVHPHMRGEDGEGQENRPRPGGSPPHAWGRRARATLGSPTRRFTPTCVGKTLSVIISRVFVSVHPHMRGEDTGNSRQKHGEFLSTMRITASDQLISFYWFLLRREFFFTQTSRKPSRSTIIRLLVPYWRNCKP